MPYHQSVMTKEMVQQLRIRSNGTYLDATAGDGGHSQAILEKLGAEGRLLSMDRDPQAVHSTKKRLGDDPRIEVVQGLFSQWSKRMNSLKTTQVDGIVMDLGVSARQIDDASRGFSYRKDAALDMRMDQHSGISAAQWLKHVSQPELRRVFSQHGQFPYPGKLASRIVEMRKKEAFERTEQLAQVAESVFPRTSVRRRKHPARQVFQAIRIHLNDELSELKKALSSVLKILAVKGRLVVLSFHSLEHRMVKDFFKEQSNAPWQPDKKNWDEVCHLFPSDAEIELNARARSAQLYTGTLIKEE